MGARWVCSGCGRCWVQSMDKCILRVTVHLNAFDVTGTGHVKSVQMNRYPQDALIHRLHPAPPTPTTDPPRAHIGLVLGVRSVVSRPSLWAILVSMLRVTVQPHIPSLDPVAGSLRAAWLAVLDRPAVPAWARESFGRVAEAAARAGIHPSELEDERFLGSRLEALAEVRGLSLIHIS